MKFDGEFLNEFINKFQYVISYINCDDELISAWIHLWDHSHDFICNIWWPMNSDINSWRWRISCNLMLSYMNQGGAKVPDASLELPESRRPRQWACQAEPRPWHGTGKGQPEDRVTPTVEYQLWVTVTGQPDQGPGAVVDPDNTWLGPANFNLKLQRHNKWFQAKASFP